MNSPVEMAGYTLFVIVVLGLTVTQGLKNGVERACKWMLPILGIMLVVLAARSLTMTPQVEGGKTALDGLKWYLTPDFSKITGQAILTALGQSFFSIGIGISTAIVYDYTQLLTTIFINNFKPNENKDIHTIYISFCRL